MTNALIRQGFETRLKTWADALTPALPIAWQNVPFVAPEGRYARAFLMPSDTERLFVDGTGRQYRGVFQVSFVMVIGAGAAGGQALAASLDAAFSVSITQGGLRIYLLTPFSEQQAMQEDGRWVLPVSATYEALAT